MTLKNAVSFLAPVLAVSCCFGCSYDVRHSGATSQTELQLSGPANLSGVAPSTPSTEAHPNGSESTYASCGRRNSRYDYASACCNLELEVSYISGEVRELESKVASLRLEVDEILKHRGSLDDAQTASAEIISGADALIDRLGYLQTKATEHQLDLASKCDALEQSLEDLKTSASNLHENIETAMTNPRYRHHEGIPEMQSNMEDTESNASAASSDCD